MVSYTKTNAQERVLNRFPRVEHKRKVGIDGVVVVWVNDAYSVGYIHAFTHQFQ